MNNQSLQNQNTFYYGEDIGDLYQPCTENNMNDDHYLRDFETGNGDPYQFYSSPLIGTIDDSGSFVGTQVSPSNGSMQKSHSLLFSSDSSRFIGMAPSQALTKILEEHYQERNITPPHRTVLSPLGMQSDSSFGVQILSPPLSAYEDDHLSLNGLLYQRDRSTYVDNFGDHRRYKVPQEVLQHQHHYQHQGQFHNPLLVAQENYSYFTDRNASEYGFTDVFKGEYITPPEEPLQGYIHRNLSQDSFKQEQAKSHASFKLNPALNKNFKSLVELCGKTNTNASVVNKSSNTHQVQNCKKNGTGRIRKPLNLQCEECFKTFSRPYNLKSHKKTHTKEKPYVCNYPDCPWRFARPHDLKRHTLCLHDGIKPYSCTCGKKFARSDAFKRHQTVDIACASQRKEKA